MNLVARPATLIDKRRMRSRFVQELFRPFVMATKPNADPADSGLRFRKAQRLRNSTEFARVFGSKYTSANDRLVVHLSKNGLARSRLGLIVSRRVGNAVRRNAIRRRIREAFRKNRHVLPSGYDVICIAKPCAGNLTSDLAESFCTLVVAAAQKAVRRGLRNTS